MKLEEIAARLSRPGVKLDYIFMGGYYDTVPPCGSLDRAVSVNYTLWYLLDGLVELKFRDRTLTVTPGHWVLIMPGAVRGQFFSPGSRIISLHFRLTASYTDIIFSPELIHVVPGGELETLRDKSLVLLGYLEEKKDVNEPDFLDALHFEKLCREWLMTFYPVMAAKGIFRREPLALDHRVMKLIRELEKLSYSGGIPYERLERVCSLGRVQLDRVFAQNMGMSPRKYHDKIILSRACSQLATGTCCVKEIANELGFATLPHFSAWFKRQTGISPHAYRSSLTF